MIRSVNPGYPWYLDKFFLPRSPVPYFDLGYAAYTPEQIEVLSAQFYVPAEATGLDTQFDDMLTMEEGLR
jgi:hypothetical protein